MLPEGQFTRGRPVFSKMRESLGDLLDMFKEVDQKICS